jgi:hypothetical protein
MQNWQANPKVHMEIQGMQNRQKSFEEEQSWSTHISQLQNLRSYST